MSELCHVCDLFRTALFGPTNTEDHLDDGLGNDLPRPMADAPATMGVRPTRNRQGASQTATSSSKPGSQQQLAGGNGTTATPSIASEAAAPRAAAAAMAAEAAAGPAPTVSAATPAAAAPAAAAAVTEPSAAPAPAPAAAAAVAKPVPKTKFSKRASRGLKAAPAYMSFDDVDVEDDDSDGELFVEDSRDNRGSGASRSPGSVAAQAASSKSASAYTVNAPSVYRAPSLAPPAAAAPAAPASSDAPAGGPEDQEGYSAAAAGRGEDDGSSGVPVAVAASAKENMSSHQAIAGDSSAEILSSGSGLRGGLAGGLRLGGEQRVMSIPRDGSMLESARPHGQSESFHGYKGYPGYEPDTPVAQQLTQPGRAHATDALTINPGADVSDPRTKHAGAAGPTPSSVRFTPREMEVSSEIGSTMTTVEQEEQQQYQQQQYQQQQALGVDIDGRDDYVEEQQQHQHQNRQQRRQHRQQQQQQQPVISPSGTTSMEMATGLRPPEPRGRAAQVEVATRQQHDVDVGDGRHSNTNTGLSSRGGTGGVPMSSTGGGGGMQYGSEAGGENNSSYGGGGGHVVPSPSHSQANSMSSSYRNIQQLRSEDGMGSVLGTLAGTEDSTNEDLQWKRSALKKFHKVMVKGEGLRVVKHNRSGGSQMRIIRYDPEIKALVWNSKRYMKKAGSANVPIVGIKRVGREGNTVSVTAAGRGTIGFEPQRIRDAKILAEALRALVDKEERSAMWRG